MKWSRRRGPDACKSTPPIACIAKPADIKDRTNHHTGRHPKAAPAPTTRACNSSAPKSFARDSCTRPESCTRPNEPTPDSGARLRAEVAAHRWNSTGAQNEAALAWMP